MNYDNPDELRREAFELRRKAAATINNYRWAAQPAAADDRSVVPIPINMNAVDWDEVRLARRRVEARKVLDNALEETGLARQWAQTEEAARSRAALEGTGALGRLLSNKR